MIKAIYVIGHGRSGKDTVCELLAKSYNYTYCASSYFLSENIIFPAIKDKFGYIDAEECFKRRHEPGLRKIWFDLICEYNKKDLTRLSRNIFKEYDIYAGIRNIEELAAVRKSGNFNTIVIWVDAENRVSAESSDSFNIPKEEADYIVNNNYGLGNLRSEVSILVDYLEYNNFIGKNNVYG